MMLHLCNNLHVINCGWALLCGWILDFHFEEKDENIGGSGLLGRPSLFDMTIGLDVLEPREEKRRW